MKIVKFTLDGVERQVRKPDSAVDQYVEWMQANRPDRTDIEVSDAPLTIHEKVNEIARRINGLRVGEGNDTIDVGDLIDNNRA